MSSIFFQLVLFGILAGVANVLGGLLLFPSRLHHNYKHLLTYVLAIGAGFMLSVTFFEIIPSTVVLWHIDGRGEEALLLPMLLLLGGYLLTQFVEHTIAPHFHLGEEVHSKEVISRSSAYTAIGGLFVHTFFDGITIAAATQVNVQVGALVFIAILLHKLPEGFTIGSMVLAAGGVFRQVMFTTAAVGLTTLVGTLAFFVLGTAVAGSVAYALPIAGGVTLYVAASDLVPEVNHHGGRSAAVTLAIFAGVALFYLTHLLLRDIMPM